MGLKEFIEIGGFVIAVIMFAFNIFQTNLIKSNCIATLTARVDEIERKLTALFDKLDQHAELMKNTEISIARLEQKIKDQNGKS